MKRKGEKEGGREKKRSREINISFFKIGNI